jgi:hydroxymethylpyrimidine pyrophosphatase-like HAD family hydrolase
MIRLLSTDFDGTLTGAYPDGGRCVPSLARELAAVSKAGGIWAVNTGRSLESALEGLRELEAPITPDYILTSERHVHQPNGKGGWHDYGEWNALCREHHDLLFQGCGQFFKNIERLVGRYDGVTFQESVDGVPGGLIASSEELLDEVIRELDQLQGRPEDFHYQRSNIYLRFCHRAYDKGSALAELSRLLDMPTSGILAIGDHQNDLAMLFGKVAAMVACPANAHPTVKEAVIGAEGHVSDLETGEGTAEGIRLYRTGEKLPAIKKPGSGHKGSADEIP